VPDRLGLDRERIMVVVRPPPDVSLYHRRSNTLFPQVLSYLGENPDGIFLRATRLQAVLEDLEREVDGYANAVMEMEVIHRDGISALRCMHRRASERMVRALERMWDASAEFSIDAIMAGVAEGG
jgi:hypothetical protein